MPPDQQTSAETSRKAANLRGLLQQPASKQQVGPLVAAIVARDVDMHGRMLMDLGTKVQQMEARRSSDSKDAVQLRERMNDIEHDAKDLRGLIQNAEQEYLDNKLDPDELEAVLTKAINQHSTETASHRQHLQNMQETIEGQQQTNNRVAEMLDTMGQRIEGIRYNISGIKENFKTMSFAAPIVERLVKLEMITKCLDPRSKDAEIIKHSLTAITTNPDPQEELEHPADQPMNDGHTVDDSLTGQSNTTSKPPPNHAEWPVIAHFVTIFQGYIKRYKSKKPKDHSKFIAAFLDDVNEANIHVSCALQRYLLEKYPGKVTLVDSEVGQQYPDIFIKLTGMRWNDIRRAISEHRDLRAFEWASNEGISGPLPIL